MQQRHLLPMTYSITLYYYKYVISNINFFVKKKGHTYDYDRFFVDTFLIINCLSGLMHVRSQTKASTNSLSLLYPIVSDVMFGCVKLYNWNSSLKIITKNG